ncbi:hypothetical protein AAC387_Pa02g3167 [Persea americana]
MDSKETRIRGGGEKINSITTAEPASVIKSRTGWYRKSESFFQRSRCWMRRKLNIIMSWISWESLRFWRNNSC